ncbi:MAG TPA: hypothetical protein VKB12_04040 [Pyrinomonadaceae bacterium]|nr:hypothetical protein [Pyrinomonadaceae bacterium]
MRLALALTALLTLLPAAQNSGISYGKPEELKGLKKIFVDTGGDLKNRARITKEIEDAKLGVELLDSEAGAEVILDFGAGRSERLIGNIGRGTGGLVTKRYQTGKGRVFVVGGGRDKIVMSYEGEETHPWEDKPATNFGKAFVKAYKKANGIK